MHSLRLTDAAVWFLLPIALAVVAVGMDRNYQTDLWHHLARGRLIAAEGHLIDEDRFSCTLPPGTPLIDATWGWQVANWEFYNLGGLPLLQAVNALIVGATMALLTLLCRWRGAPPIVAAAVGVFVFFGLWQQVVLIRAQTTSFLLFMLLSVILEASVRHPRWLWMTPLVLMFWVNIHGGFPVGLALVGAYVLAAVLGPGTFAERRRRAGPFVLALVCCLLATLVNPYGWHVYEYMLHTTNINRIRHIDEWLPTGTDSLIGRVFVTSLLALLLLFPLSGRRPAIRELCALAIFLPPACGAVRMVGWWLLVVGPILAVQLAAVWPRKKQPADDQPTFGTTIGCVALLAAMILSLPWLERINPLARTERTEDSLDVVASHLENERPGGIFTRFSWAEYLGWRLAPRDRVFFDGRIELYPDEIWNEYEAVVRGRADWEEILKHRHVEWLVLDAGSSYHSALLPLVEASPHWRKRPGLSEGNAVVFERNQAEFEPQSHREHRE